MIIDIRNIYDLDRNLTGQLFSEFETILSKKLCRDFQCNNMNRLTMGDLDCNVIIMFDHEYGPDYACRNIESPWINKNDNSGLFEQLDANLIYGRPRSSLYVSQIVLTPSAWNIVSNIDSRLEKWEAPTMNKSLQWLNLHHAGGRHGFNIVIRDFVDTEFTRTVIAKNLYPENDVVSRV